MLGTSWAHVEPMLSLCWPMLGLCWPTFAQVGPMFAPWLAYVGPMLSHLGGYVGHMLGICWLSWAYVEDMLGNISRLEERPTKCRLSLSARLALLTPPLKNTAFLHFSLFPASYFDMRNKPCNTQCFSYLTHTKPCKLR